MPGQDIRMLFLPNYDMGSFAAAIGFSRGTGVRAMSARYRLPAITHV